MSRSAAGATVVASQARVWAQAPFDTMSSLGAGWAGYLASALRSRRTTPLTLAEDVAEWWRAATVRTPPAWQSRHRVVRTWPQARLLDFDDGSSAAGTPILVLPPQAGHASTIVDYSAGQSQVQTARSASRLRVCALDWLPATGNTADSTIEDYIAILDDTIAELGGRVHLAGDCQGGWLAAIYAALRPEAVRSLALGGAPIDFHAGASAIQEWMGCIAPNGDLAVYRALVDAGGGKHLGINQIRGFKMLEPVAELDRLSLLWSNIHDADYVQRHVDFTNWFEWSQDLPGAFYLWIIEHLFMNNELVRGTLDVGGVTVDLSRITVPLFLLAGTTDHVTPEEQAFAISHYASTPPSDVHTYLVSAGHLGLFMGRAALAGPWTEIFGQMAALDEES